MSLLLITVDYSYVVKYIIIIVVVIVRFFGIFVWTSCPAVTPEHHLWKTVKDISIFIFLKDQLKTLQKPEEETKSNYLFWDSNPCCDAGTFLYIISVLSYVWKIIQRMADSQSCWENMYTFFRKKKKNNSP